MGRRKQLLLLIAVAVSILGAGYAASSDRPSSAAASAVGCDQILEDGTAPDAFIAGLGPGETGCLRAGVHEVERIATIKAPDVTLTSFPGESATLAGRLWIRRGADRALVENLSLDGRNDEAKPSPTVNADRAVFRGNDVSNGHSAICFVIGDDTYGSADGTVIEGNRIHDCGRLPPANHDHGIYVAHADATLIYNNLIYSNADRGVQLYPDADRTIVAGNVIDGNGEGVNLGGDDDEASDRNLVVGNLITLSNVRYNVEANWPGPVGQGNLALGNCVWMTRPEYAGRPQDSGLEPSMDGVLTARNVISDPDYADADGGDFSLGGPSLCSPPSLPGR